MSDNSDWEDYGWFENGANNTPSFDTEFGFQGNGVDSLANAIDTNAAANFNLDDFMTELQGMGTDLGPASDMGMDQDLLNQIGLPNLSDWQNYAFYEGGDQNTKDAYDRAEALKADNIDVGGGYNPATGKGDAATAAAALKTGVTGSASDVHGDTTKTGTVITPGGTNGDGGLLDKLKSVITGTKTDGAKSGMDPAMMMMLMLMMSQMGKGGGSTGSSAVIPTLTSDRKQLPYTKPSRPGAGGVNYFSPNTYTPKMAGGGIASAGNAITMAGGGISSLGSYSDGGRLLKGPGDGVSDSIPATIGGHQKAALADGEFVVPARIVSELGNGSTDAGARKLYAMMDRIQKERRKTKNVAADTKASKHLPA